MLIGIRPDTIHEVAYQGATFRLGLVDRATWMRLKNRSLVAYEEALRRGIVRVRAEGRDPGERIGPEPAPGERDTRPSMADLAALVDLEHKAQRHAIELDALKHSLRGHEGFVYQREDGTTAPVPFVTSGGLVSDETIAWYSVAPELLGHLFAEMHRLHELQPHEKKA
jgi:hypothetical protein